MLVQSAETALLSKEKVRVRAVTYRDEHHSRMVLNPRLVPFAHKAERAYKPRHQQLHRQDGVNLANELVANIDGRLRNAAAKLEVIGQVVVAIHAAARDAREQSRLILGSGLVGRWCLAVGGSGGTSAGYRVGVVLRGGCVLCVGHGDGRRFFVRKCEIDERGRWFGLDGMNSDSFRVVRVDVGQVLGEREKNTESWTSTTRRLEGETSEQEISLGLRRGVGGDSQVEGCRIKRHASAVMTALPRHSPG